MPCTHVRIGSVAAIVCTPTRRCRSCGKRADLLCDWKVPTKRSGTCDAPICASCTTSPAADKDLCRVHAEVWGEQLARFGGRVSA